ncbi:ribonuclease T2-like protein, partial [Thelephora terrestris]
GLEGEGQILPEASWHGAWPDNCDGSYGQYRDFSRQYDPSPSPDVLPNSTTIPPYKGPGIDTLSDDLADMVYYYSMWINQGAPNADIWAHRPSEHGICTSTFDVTCYSNYQEHEEVVNFFETAIRGFQRYPTVPTYDLLVAYGITPSNDTTYQLANIQDALKAQTSAVPYIGCINDGTSLEEGHRQRTRGSFWIDNC